MPDLTNEWRHLMEEWPKVEVGYKTSPLHSAYDDAITNLVRAFKRAVQKEREALQRAVQAESVTPLLMYAERMASLALKDNDVARVSDGLAAVAMRGETPDPRDSLYSLALLYNSASELSQDAQLLFDAAAAVASPFTAQALLAFTRERGPGDRTLRAFGFRKVQDSSQPLLYSEDG